MIPNHLQTDIQQIQNIWVITQQIIEYETY